MRERYKLETGKNVWCGDMNCGCGGGDGSYSDEYVKWLESKIKPDVAHKGNESVTPHMNWWNDLSDEKTDYCYIASGISKGKTTETVIEMFYNRYK